MPSALPGSGAKGGVVRGELSERPTLAAHVLARRHVVEGVERIVLHDLEDGRLLQIGPREWGLLAAADGTRDLEGILIAAAREGAHARAPALRAFLEQLHATGWLDDGSARETQDARDGRDELDAARDGLDPPLDPLPDFTLACDGRGSCCRIYASIVFAPVEAARARSLLPEVLGGGERHERVFMPERGSGPTGGAGVAMRDGRCAYLADSGRCGLHEAGGPTAKPVGCTLFPATFVDDGESVRVSAAVECACVLASVGRADGAALVPGDARTRADLHPSVAVARMPDLVPIPPSCSVPRAELVAWSRRVAKALERAAGADMAAALLTLSAGVAIDGLGADVEAAFACPAPVDLAAERPWIEALRGRAERRARDDAAWRSPSDLARRATLWIEAAAATLVDADARSALLASPLLAGSGEAFYVRALVHGHQLVGGLPLSLALHDRAVRLLVARALRLVFAQRPEEELDTACAEPLALVEAMLRGHGLDAYAYDVTA